jgi:hypothetical protein
MPERRPPAARRADEPPEECANCGSPIPRHSRACPECGADEQTGWRETSLYDDLDLPASAYEDDDSGSRRPPPTHRVNGIAWYWWIVGVVVIAVSLLFLIGFR